MNIIKFEDFVNESLPQQNSVDQLKKLRKLTKGIDIGDRISDMNKQGANIDYIHNVIDNGIESIQDYQRSNKNFDKKVSLRRIKPFKGYVAPQVISEIKKKKRKTN